MARSQAAAAGPATFLYNCFMPIDWHLIDRGTNFLPTVELGRPMGMNGTGAASAGWIGRVIIGRNPKLTLVRILIWILIVGLGSQYVLVPIRVEGISMLDTYKDNAIKFVNCLAYAFHPPQRGDIVAIKMAGKSIMLCKRIVALPGETIAFHRGRLFINGEPLEEPYVKGPCHWEADPEIVGSDEYYFVGDNRTMDYRLHDQGRASRQRILGKVVL
jgi:signal peptidase I